MYIYIYIRHFQKSGEMGPLLDPFLNDKPCPMTHESSREMVGLNHPDVWL